MGKIQINSKQLPIKAHFFFFMAAMGPILPFTSVYGRQLGISPMVMGTMYAILPLLFLISKPAFGFVVDYFRGLRKFIFIVLLIVTSLAFVSMYFLPRLNFFPLNINEKNTNLTSLCNELYDCESLNITISHDVCHDVTREAHCRWSCNINKKNYSASAIFVNSENTLSRKSFCLVRSTNETFDCDETNYERNCPFSCVSVNDERCLYESLTFWGFVILVSLGSIGFNVSNSISDAICFDVLGAGGEMGYGRQRVWGAIGFGVTSLLAGYAIDVWSEGEAMKSYTPAFILVFAFTCFDVLCCTKLELPAMNGSENIAKDVWRLLKLKPVAIFLFFATIAGIFDSFIIYFMFWYLEDLATVTGHMEHVKLIEGLTVAAETLGGEVIFFSFSGKILKRFGYGYSFVFCFVCYALRLGLISIIPSPWWVISIEFFMQGPTYALCYTTIVAFASVVAPPGTSATVQGIVAGMDDGFGFAVGSLLGGFLYLKVGGARTFRIFSTLAACSAVMYLLLHITYLRHVMPQTKKALSNGTPLTNVEWKSPEEAARGCNVGNNA